ncbi:NAD-dependent epimerase/dehydratase family protein [Thermovibrio sp.]
MRVLIVGASGFIGSHLLKGLKGKYSLFAVSRREVKGAPSFTFSSLSYAFKEVKPQVVVNCVGILKEEGENTFEKAHVEVVKELLKLSGEVSVKKFIHISALGVERERSSYQKTKLKGEELVKTSGIPYLILRPSIVLGEGQKLYEDLKRLSKFLPFLVAPKMKVQPVKVEKVVEAVRKGIECRLKGVIPLCGEEVISMGELFKRVLKELEINRPVVEVPKVLLFPVALFGLFGFNLDQYRMIEDNTCREEKVGRAL